MENLNISNKKLLLLLSVVLVLFIIINSFINKDKNSIIDYSKDISAKDLISKGTEISDRKIYFTLESIIIKYVNSYNNAKDESGNLIDLENEYEYSYEEQYDSLVDSYKSYLNKKEYITVADKFMNKLLVKSGDNDTEVHYFMDTNALVKGVYQIADNTYMCKLYSSYNDKEAYIGIVLDTKNSTYGIFFIE